jgi:formylglycine-generating enzyme required for sulfatase activity
MKSCPICDRTFDETLTFCLIDGSVLSAPFDPHSIDHKAVRRDREPPPTRMIDPGTSSGTSRQQSYEALPPTRALSDDFARGAESATTSSPRFEQSDNPRSEPVMKTIQAPAPEVVFNEPPRAFSSPAVFDQRPEGTMSSRSRALVAGVVAILLIGVIGGVIWWLIRNRKVTPATQTTSTQTAAATTKTAPSGSPFTEKVNGAEIEMLAIPGGNFLMGSPATESGRDPDEGPQSNVTVPNYYMGKYEVTQSQYRAVMGANPSAFKGDDLPVDSVTWAEATEFCRKLSTLSGRHYRLPTEAEWEYAARAGTTGAPTESADLTAWYDGNSGARTHPVGQKEANHFGLYDIYGNVWEWCQSKYKAYPYSATDGREDLQSVEVRVLRGGSWESAAKACRPSYRRRVTPDPRSAGFRVVRVGD